MIKLSSYRVRFTSALLASCAVASPALAQEVSIGEASQSGGIDEIVVTAQKRAENIQDVPLAVTAVSGDILSDRNITDASGLVSLVPNVGFNTAVGETRIAIRGITFENITATGAEARVAYHQDGVYLSRSGNINGTFFDVERVEVLRGPQGTLFGRNAIAGAVNLITRDPTDTFEGYVEADIGNYNSVVVQGAVSGPLTDGISLRLAGRTSDHDGYGTNLVTGQETDAQSQRDFRAKLKIEPSDGFTAILSADYSRNKANAGYYFGGFAGYPGVPPVAGGVYPSTANLRDINSNTDPKAENEFYGFGANVTVDLSSELSLVSITSYRRGKEFLQVDNDYTQLARNDPAQFGSKSKQLSQELQLQGDFDWGNVLLGAYYFNEKYKSGAAIAINLALFGGDDVLLDALRYGGNLETKSYAAFAQTTIDLTDAFHVTLGARYTKDKKSRSDAFFQFDFAAIGPYTPPVCQLPCGGTNGVLASNFQPYAEKTWNNFSPKVTIAYDINDDVNVYATYSKGFKSGGFQPGLDITVPGLGGNGFNPEKLTDYEVGLKGDFFDRRLRINLAGFYYDYKNLQVFRVLDDAVGAVLQNAAAAKLYGAEAEITAIPVEGIQINLAGAVMKSKFTDFLSLDPTRPNGPNGDPTELFNLSGNRLPSAPTYTINAGIQWTVPSDMGEFVLRAETATQSRLYFDQYQNPNVSSPAYTIGNLFVNWESNAGNIYGSLYIKNIGNTFRYAGASVGNGFFGSPVQTTFIPPETYGFKVGVRF